MERDATPPPEPDEERDKLRLKVVDGNAAGTVIEVEEELLIGREIEGHGALASDIEISRRHARIASEGGGAFAIEDLGSTNGTYVNGRRLQGKATLGTGDRIEVGMSALVVQVGNLQPTPTASGTIAPPPGDADLPTEERPPARAPGRPASFAVRIDVNIEAGRATVSLDEASDEVNLVLEEDGRWRLS